ncbi:MAG: 1-acyl-sn-glycerol-3-phosphate acyltransferase [Flavobacteriales bacterium]|nr:1-acyl-sn-glycerol-3-phosphate acyltransferase [Flavobacteriales bacterium]
MNKLLWFPRVVYKLYFLVVFTSYLVLVYPIFYWATAKESRYKMAFNQLNNWSRFVVFFTGIIVKKEGVKNLPKNCHFILCSNHASYLDIIIMYRVLSDYFVMMGKGEIKDWPLFHRFFTTGMNILVDRKSNIASHRAFEEAKRQLDKGHNVVIFPEGGIPDFHTPKMKGFKNGAFKLAIEKQVPIIPLTFQTNWKLLEGARSLGGHARPGISKIIIHPPIETKGMTMADLTELRTKTRSVIAAPLKQFYT